SVSNIRTRFEGQGYTKIVKFEGQKHMIHIENKGSFSEVDDYLLIRSKKGHEMTYPLSCNWK
ncbi:MAG: hypothetical protein HOM21_10000, partial [Halobacteriovoraceae bacterium]|nr:hypothetical protein [Halobacteriovoraceae bacterium]